jgi:putative transposase
MNDLCIVKLTLQIKLLPTQEQFTFLKNTLVEANTACNEISNTAFTKKLYNQYKLHHEVYHRIKSSFNLSAQMVVRCISKVADSYKLDKKVKREFRQFGAITYDSRILTYNKYIISLWTVGGRLKVPFVCHNQKYIPYIKGEADLVFKKGKFYLFQTVEVPEEDVKDVESFIGCDFGINDIVVTSDGIKHSAEWLNTYREHRQKVRSSIQAKADTSKRSTKRNCRKLSKRLSGKERTTANLINHTISKSIVVSAKEQGKGISIEDLTNIRFTSKRRNTKFRTKLGKWNFADLRAKLEYKALLNGVNLVVVEPAYTSKTCSVCKHIGKRTNKSFECANCGNNMDADFNASLNIATLGSAVNHSEKSDMYCSIALHCSGLKPLSL